MLVKNTEVYYTIRLGGAWINRKRIMSIWLTYNRIILKSDTTYKAKYKSFRICKLQRRK